MRQLYFRLHRTDTQTLNINMTLEQLPLDFTAASAVEPESIPEPVTSVAEPEPEDNALLFGQGDYVQPIWHPPLMRPAFMGQVLEVMKVAIPFNHPGCWSCGFKSGGCDDCYRYYAKPLKWSGRAPAWPFRAEELLLLSAAKH